MIFLSLVNSTADFFYPAFLLLKKKNPSHSEYFTDIESRFWCEILCLPLLFIVIAFNMLQLVLKVFFFLLFGITVWLARALQNMYVWMKSSDYNPIELLHYAYLSDKEKKIWISRVEPYVYKNKKHNYTSTKYHK